MIRLALCIFLILLSPGLSFGESNSYKAQEVLALGPPGGDVMTILIDERTPGMVVAGTAEGNIFTSTTEGEKWQRAVLNLPLAGYSIEAVIQGFSSNELLAGLRHEDQSGVILKSTDNGLSWNSLATDQVLPAVRALAVSTAEKNTLLAGTTTGLWISRDQGSSWTRTFEPSPNQSVASISIDSHDPATIYIGTWRRAFRSRDRGTTFKSIWTGMAEDSHVFRFINSPRNAGRVFAATCGWVYRSEHYGDKWSILKKGLEDRRILDLTLIPLEEEKLFAATPSGLFYSKGTGTSWQKSTVFGDRVNTISANSDGQIVFLGMGGRGIYKSSNGGNIFVPFNNGFLASQIDCFIKDGDTVFSAIPVSDRRSKIYFGPWKKPMAYSFYSDHNSGKVLSILPLDPSPESLSVLVGTHQGLFQFQDKPLITSKINGLHGPIRCLRRDHLDNKVIYAATGRGFFMSSDAGQSWMDMSPSDYHGETFDILIDLSDSKRIFLSTLIGIYSTRDQGKSWHRHEMRIPRKKTKYMAQDPHNHRVFLALSESGLVKSIDGGHTWFAPIIYYFPANSSFLLFDPLRPDYIYTNDLQSGEIYFTRNHCSSWNPLPLKQRVRIVDAITITEDNAGHLLMATVGYGLAITPIPAIE